LRFHLEETIARYDITQHAPRVVLVRCKDVRHSAIVEQNENAVMNAGDYCELPRRKACGGG
jgi:hypothetical protein